MLLTNAKYAIWCECWFSFNSCDLNLRQNRNFPLIYWGADDFRYYCLFRPPAERYGLIDKRVDKMMEEGLLEEARMMLPYREANALNTVGYKELFSYFDGIWELDEAVERIKGNTRRYARKQLTWFKRDQQMKWFHPDEQEQIMKYISEYE